MSATLRLDPDATLRLIWAGVPTDEEVKAAKAIPGARAIQGGFEWGWWPETAARVAHQFATNGFSMPTLVGGFGPEGWTWVDPDRTAAIPWRSPTEPKAHQRDFKSWRRGGGIDGLFHPTAMLEAGLGLGKTLSAIEEILELLQYRPHAKVLVLARNSLLETVWGAQLDQHSAGLPFAILNQSRVKRTELLARVMRARHAAVLIHSHEDLPAMGRILAGYEWDMLIVDETAAFRTAGAQRTSRLTAGASARPPKQPLTAPYRLGLSGLPMIKSATDLYPVLRWLGAPTGNKAQFLERFMAQNPMKHELRLRDPEGLKSLLDCYRFQVPKSAVLQIPRAWHYEKIELNPWQRALYAKIQKQLKDLDDEELAGSRLEELLRLAQVTAGFEGETYRGDNAKLEHLVERVLPELGDEQAIIWVRFRNEALGVLTRLLNLRKTAGAFTGAQHERDNDDAYRSFTQGHQQYFVPTLAKGAIGLNLPMAATMVYLSRDFNTELWAQSLDRNYRLTTKHQALNVIVIEAERSIDQKVTQILGDDLRAAAELTALDVKEVLGR